MIEAQKEIPFFRMRVYEIDRLSDPTTFIFKSAGAYFLTIQSRFDGRFNWRQTAFGSHQTKRDNEKMFSWFRSEYTSADLHLGRILSLDATDVMMIQLRSSGLVIE